MRERLAVATGDAARAARRVEDAERRMRDLEAQLGTEQRACQVG